MAMKRMHTNSNYCSVAAQAIIPFMARSKQGGRGLGGDGSRWRLSFVLCASQESSWIALLISITIPALLGSVVGHIHKGIQDWEAPGKQGALG